MPQHTEDAWLNATPRQHTTPHWSAHVMWGGVLFSALIIIVALLWSLGKQLAHENRIRERAVRSCTQLLHPPERRNATPSDAEIERCEAMVSTRHRPCMYALDELARRKLRYPHETRHVYLACIMEGDEKRAAQ